MKLMIRADDLGYSRGVNYGIYDSVKHGVINNVGVMVNMPDTQHGVNLLKDLDVCFGQHTNICVGKPLSDPSKIPSLVQENGEFKPSSAYRNATEDFVDLDEVILEIEAQYERYKQLMGKEPEYFEGHAVVSDNFLKGLEIVAKRHGLKYFGFAFDDKPIIVNDNKVFIHMEAMDASYDPFAMIKRIVEKPSENAFDLVVFHPGYLDANILEKSSLTTPRTQEVKVATSKELQQFLTVNNIHLYTYNEL